MTDHDDLIDRYIAAWNETDPAARRALVAATFAEDARYLDPVMQGEGHAGLDGMIAAVQARFAGLRFTRSGRADAHHDHLRFSWDLGPAGGEAMIQGTDFATLAADRRLVAVTGFFDKLPQA